MSNRAAILGSAIFCLAGSYPVSAAVFPNEIQVCIFNAVCYCLVEPFSVIGMNRVIKVFKTGFQSGISVTKHGANAVGPMQIIGIDIPFPGADVGVTMGEAHAFFVLL